MTMCGVSRALAAAVLVLCTALPACDHAMEDIERTLTELEMAANRHDGEGFARWLAPESFQHYDRLIKIALDGNSRQIEVLPMSERYDVLVMRNRSTRKELSKMDGRAWVVHIVNQGWLDGQAVPNEDLVDKKVVRVSGTSATLEIIYDVRQPLFTGEGSGRKFSDTIGFQKVDDLWLADARRPSVLFERMIALLRQAALRTPYQLMIGMEEKATGKPVPTDIWDRPMR